MASNAEMFPFDDECKYISMYSQINSARQDLMVLRNISPSAILFVVILLYEVCPNLVDMMGQHLTKTSVRERME